MRVQCINDGEIIKKGKIIPSTEEIHINKQYKVQNEFGANKHFTTLYKLEGITGLFLAERFIEIPEKDV